MSRILKNMLDVLRKVHPLLLMLSLAVSARAFTAQAQWTLAQDEGNIQIYTRPVADSPFLEVKAVVLLNAPIEKVAVAMGDGEGCGEWRAMCKSSKVLSTPSDTERYVYLVLDLPWPLSDRDMVIHSIAHIDIAARTVTVQLEDASSEQPETEHVRAISSGSYQIKAMGDGKAEFTYTLHTDLGGNLSPDMINPRVTASTYDDIKRLQALAEQ